MVLNASSLAVCFDPAGACFGASWTGEAARASSEAEGARDEVEANRVGEAVCEHLHSAFVARTASVAGRDIAGGELGLVLLSYETNGLARVYLMLGVNSKN